MKENTLGFTPQKVEIIEEPMTIRKLIQMLNCFDKNLPITLDGHKNTKIAQVIFDGVRAVITKE